MKYLTQYVESLSDKVVVSHSKSTESVYYDFGYGFVVRLSDHIKSNTNKTPTISVSKIFNSQHFLVQVEQSPYPLVKTRSEVKELVRNAMQIYILKGMTKNYLDKKAKIKLSEYSEWSVFWSDVCMLYSLARHFSKDQKNVFKKYFNKGINGSVLFDYIKMAKLTHTPLELEDIFSKLKK